MYHSQPSTSTKRVCSGWIGLLAAALLVVAPGCGVFGGEVVPDAPSSLEATSEDAEVILTWQATADADEYNVYRSTSPEIDRSSSPVAEGLTETSYSDTGVENGTTYYYVVTGVADEEGEPSEEEAATPFSGPPSRPE